MTTDRPGCAECAEKDREIARLRKALEPFAKEADTWDEKLPRKTEMTIGMVRYSPSMAYFVFGDFVRARAALGDET